MNVSSKMSASTLQESLLQSGACEVKKIEGGQCCFVDNQNYNRASSSKEAVDQFSVFDPDKIKRNSKSPLTMLNFEA